MTVRPLALPRPLVQTIVAASVVLGAAPALLAPVGAGAQPAPQPSQQPARAVTGRITGRVLDAKTGAGLTDAGVQVVGTTLGTMSGVDGRFTLAAVPAGTVTLQVRRIGYQPKTITGIVLAAGRTVEQDVTLGAATVRLQAVAVTAAAERGTVSQALDRQRTATGVVNAITSEQIARSPDGDAAAAVTRVSGVTVQDGKYVFVRGLGERYTTASLNGARIPSPEPERRVVPLDLFPAGLLQSVTTSKTFTPDQQGDFSGAQVDIQTREFPARRVTTVTTGSGMNTAATGRSIVRAPRLGSEWAGFSGSRRSMPAAIAGAGDLTGLDSRPALNGAVRAFRNRWSPIAAEGLPNASTSLSVGGQDPILGQRIGYIASLSYQASQEARLDEVRGTYQGDQGGRPERFAYFDGQTGRESVLWGGLLNLSTMLGGRTRLMLNNTYNRTSDNEAHVDQGTYEPFLGDAVRRTTLRFVERSVRSNQLRGEHSLSDRQQLDWSVTSSGVRRDEPDRSDFVYRGGEAPNGDPLPLGLLENGNGALRTFGALRESNLSLDASHRITFGPAERATQLKVGAFFRRTARDADNRQFDLSPLGGRLSQQQRAQDPEYLYARYSGDQDSVFNIRPLGFGGSYDASDRLTAGFAMVELPLAARLRLVGGARLENARIRVRSEVVNRPGVFADARLDDTDLLPSLALNMKVSERQNVRLSASQTLSRPEYRELSPVLVTDVLGDGARQGNASLRRGLIRNYDARWELYPSAGEVLSVGVFGKQFVDPIERIDLATSGQPLVTFANARGASNLGVELEARTGLGRLAPALAPLSAFVNATVMRSQIRLDRASGNAGTNLDRPMVGQAPYVVNTGVSYASLAGGVSATLLYNRVGPRIFAAGTDPLPDVYEHPRNLLDLSLRLPLMARVAAKLDLRNLLDAPVLVTQGEGRGDAVRERYRVGRVVSAGLSFQP